MTPTEQARKRFAEADEKVNALPNLTDAQREHAREIVHGFLSNTTGREPSYETIANHARSYTERPTPVTKPKPKQ